MNSNVLWSKVQKCTSSFSGQIIKLSIQIPTTLFSLLLKLLLNYCTQKEHGLKNMIILPGLLKANSLLKSFEEQILTWIRRSHSITSMNFRFLVKKKASQSVLVLYIKSFYSSNVQSYYPIISPLPILKIYFSISFTWKPISISPYYINITSSIC